MSEKVLLKRRVQRFTEKPCITIRCAVSYTYYNSQWLIVYTFWSVVSRFLLSAVLTSIEHLVAQYTFSLWFYFYDYN